MSLPSVSCLCPTFGRVSLLEEAIESFLRQDYGGWCELVVCNDLIEQQLVFNHPKVRVINESFRHPTLGDKRNATAALAYGDLLLTWGDDDIHLPHRISRMVASLQEQGGDFLLEGHHFCFSHEGMRRNAFSTAGAHIVSRGLYNELGGVPHINMGEDVGFNEKVSRKTGRYPLPTCKDDPAFIYRWQSSRPHVSALSQQVSDELNGYTRMGLRIQELLANGQEPKGQIHLRPRWTQDWETLAKEAT